MLRLGECNRNEGKSWKGIGISLDRDWMQTRLWFRWLSLFLLLLNCKAVAKKHSTPGKTRQFLHGYSIVLVLGWWKSPSNWKNSSQCFFTTYNWQQVQVFVVHLPLGGSSQISNELGSQPFYEPLKGHLEGVQKITPRNGGLTVQLTITMVINHVSVRPGTSFWGTKHPPAGSLWVYQPHLLELLVPLGSPSEGQNLMISLW